MSAAGVPLLIDERIVGMLHIDKLPRGVEAPEDRGDDPARTRLDASVRLAEESIYRYTLEIAGRVQAIEPAELFDADTNELVTGRLRTKQAVGRVEVRVAVEGEPDDAVGAFDVRPQKLADEAAFRGMLGDLADVAVDVLHGAFGAAGGHYGSSPSASPRLLYQQFAVLHARLLSDDFDRALARVLHQPHRTWVSTEELRPVGMGVKGTSRLARTLATGGHRMILESAPHLASLPTQVPIVRTDETLDTIPNRFLRFVLERWRGIAADALDATEKKLLGATLRRGRIECQRVLDHIDGILSEPLFREVGRLTTAPQANQVLLKRDGYRQITALSALVEMNLGLDVGLDDPFIVQRRSISTLYEMWCFVQLAQAVGAACELDQSALLFDVGDQGMSLAFRQGSKSELTWSITRLDRRLKVSLFFNRTFARAEGSWTRMMRPDCSLRISLDPGSWYGDQADTWVHFDAKYRIETVPFAEADDDGEDEISAKRADLLKMHAYRDAIRASAGAYVLYPGTESPAFQFGPPEPLPGIGALPLRPQHREADVAALRRIVDDLIDHVATQTTRHERARYWSQRAYEAPAGAPALDAVRVLEVPPADTAVLISAHPLGTLPGALAATPLVTPELVLGTTSDGRTTLLQREGPWTVRDGRLEAHLNAVPVPPWIEGIQLDGGAPRVRTWLEVARAAADGLPV